MPDLTSIYPLFDSQAHMLAPDSLSQLLDRPVTWVEVRPLTHNGLAGGRLSLVQTDAGRFVLKQLSAAFDYGMAGTQDQQCRSVTVWQYGLLDKLRPHAGHEILACAREGETWTLMMEDLSSSVLSNENPIPPDLVPAMLDTLARLHATFWNRPELQEPALGLCSTADLIALSTASTAARYNHPALGILPELVHRGWQKMEELLDARVFRQMVSLAEAPGPLLTALERYPVTLVHGDYRQENLAYTDRFTILDWQVAARSLMTIDLAWLINGDYVRYTLGRERAIDTYRQCLETHLNQRFADREWQAMVALGAAVHALRLTCFMANWYLEADNSADRARIQGWMTVEGQRVMEALRWL